MGKLPAFPFYPGDWLRDPIAGCSLAAQGLWLRLMILMHDSERYGYLVMNGSPIPPGFVARKCGCDTLSQYETLLAELDSAAIPSRTPEGIIYSRRMVRDALARSKDAERKRSKRHTSGKCPDSVRHLSAHGEDEDESENKKVPKARERNPLFDALARACGSEPAQLTNGARRTVGVALAEIRAVFPNVTPDEIGRRAEAYRKLMPTATLTESALAKHWARCVPGSTTHPKAADPYVEPAGWRDTLREIYRNVDRERVDDLCRTEWADLSLNVRNDILKNLKS